METLWPGEEQDPELREPRQYPLYSQEWFSAHPGINLRGSASEEAPWIQTHSLKFAPMSFSFSVFDSNDHLPCNKGSWHKKQLSKEMIKWKTKQATIKMCAILRWTENSHISATNWFLVHTDLNTFISTCLQKQIMVSLALKGVWDSPLWSKIIPCPKCWDSYTRYQENTQVGRPL